MTSAARKSSATGSAAGACVAARSGNKSQDLSFCEQYASQFSKEWPKRAIVSGCAAGTPLSTRHLLSTLGAWLPGTQWLKRLCVTATLLLVALFAYFPQDTAASPQKKSAAAAVKDAQTEEPGLARFIRDENSISIIEFSGDYDMGLTAPRMTVAKEFFRTHADAYDFLVVFTSFEFPKNSSDEVDALAFYSSVRNDTQGIGLEQFDNSSFFGSRGVLQGYIDMEAVNQWSGSTSSAGYDQLLSVFAHELQHRWGVYVKFRDWNGNGSNALLGYQGAHWSNLLDTQGSVLHGASWRDNGDGTFTSVGDPNRTLDPRSIYNPLDLYLAGMIDKSKVPPSMLIEAPEIDATAWPPPPIGTTIHGIKHMVTVDDIIAVEGPRIPAADVSQKSFRFAFIYLVRPGETIDPAQLAVVAQARRQVGLRYNALTHGMGTANVFAEPPSTTSPGLPSTILPPSTPAANPGSNAAGLSWLKSQQKPDGSFMDATGLAPRDTLLARSYLRAADPVYSGLGTATAWVTGFQASNTDFLARKLIESTAGERQASDVSALLAARNDDGGWGLGEHLRSNPLDTALAVQSLRLANADENAFRPAIDLLFAWQNTDGGWGNAPASPSRVQVTAQVLKALAGLANAQAPFSQTKLFLKSKQNTDGGFGDGASSIHDTANAAMAMANAGFGTEIDLPAAQRFVAESQRVDGSWQGSVYSTVLALQLLRTASAANLAIGNLQASPLPVFDGQRLTLSAKVTNAGSVQSQASTVRFFDGDPSTGGTPIGDAVPIPALVGGDSTTVQTSWNTTSRAGEHTVFAVVDFEQLTDDLIRQDNTTSLSLVVESASPLPDVLIGDGDVLATPSTVSSLPATIQIDALISNAGLAGVADAQAVLWSDNGGTRTRVAETTFSVAARATTAVQFKPTLSVAGTTIYIVELDPDGLLHESTRDNNSASVTVKTVGGVSLAVNRSDITLSPEIPKPGADVVFAVRLHNIGTQDSTSFNVRYSIRSSASTTPILTNVVQIPAGGAIEQQIPWRPDQGGSYSFIVEMDPEQVSGDGNLADNTATLDFNVAATAGLNLAVSYKDLTFTPNPALEGYDVAISALVRNVGDVAAPGSIEVWFYDGDPNAGGTAIGSTSIDALPAGGSATATVNWEVPTAAERLIFVVVDPEHKLSGETDLDDNTAFTNLKVLTLPDFAISQGALTLSPNVPTPGEATVLTVNVANLGEQAADNVVVSAFIGSPDDGIKLAPDVVLPTLASQANASAQFSFNAPTTRGLNTITVVVNPQSAIKERVRDNNTATISLGTQEGNFSVSEAFISPNGDGVKDSTVLTYRLSSAMLVTVQVTDERGSVVRTAGPWEAASSGSWQWDGLDDDGRLVEDGRYELSVRNAQGAVLGGATVEVDTNRSSLIAAMGNPAGIDADLTCTLPSAVSSVMSIPDGSGFYLSAPTARNPLTDLPAGIYREDEWGHGLRLVLGGLQQVNSDTPMEWDSFVANEQGTRIVAYNSSLQQLVSAGGEGEGRKVIFNGSVNSLIGLSKDSSEVFVVLGDSSLGAINTTTGAQRALGISNVYNIRQSPDKQRLIADRSIGGTVWLDLASAASTSLPAVASNYYWSPDGKFLVGYKAGAFVLLDANGNSYSEISTQNQSGKEAWTEDSSKLYIPVAATCPVVDNQFTKCALTIRSVEIATGSSTDDVMEFAFDPNDSTLPIRDSVVSSSQTLQFKDSVLGMVPGRNELAVYIYVWSSLYDLRGLVRYRLIDLRSHSVISDLGYYGYNDGWIVGDEYNILWAYIGNINGFSIEYGRGVRYYSLYNPAHLPQCGTEEQLWRQNVYVFRTLANLQTDLVLTRQPDGVSVKIHGGVADKNFARYWLDYASDDTPDVWHPIISASTTPVWDKDLTLWVSPGLGRYTVRLTAEDLAGNRAQKLRRVMIAENGPPITNVVREPAYISPNGDGINDQMTLSYRVLEPVNLEFSIYNQQGALVRTMSRSHPVGNVDAQIVWDGRDNNGQIVADGEYRMNVVGFDFFVTVDNSAPVINALSSGPPFSLCSGSPCRATELRWSVTDANFDSVQLEVGDGVEPSQWRPYMGAKRLANNMVGGNAVYLPLADYVGKRYRLTAVDLAGNRTVAQFYPAQPAVQLMLAGQILDHDLRDGETPPAPPTAGSWSNAQQLGLRPASGIAMIFAETLDDPIVAASVQFNGNQLAQQGEWLEQPNIQVYPLNTGQRVPYLVSIVAKPPTDWTLEQSVLDENRPMPKNYGMVGFFNGNIDADKGTRIRLKLTGRSGEQYTTNEIVVKDVNSIKLSASITSVGETTLTGVVRLQNSSSVQKLDIFISSPDDPYYVIERKIFSVGSDFIGNGASIPISQTGRYVSCAQYVLKAVATLNTGQTLTVTSGGANCGGVQFKIRPDFADCNESAHHRWHGFATPTPGKTGAVPLLSLEIFAEYPNGGRQLVFNVVNPAYQPYEFTVDHGAFPEGNITLTGVTTDLDGTQRSSSFVAPVDHTPATLRITYPQENQRVCAIPELHPRQGVGDETVNALRPVVEIDDAAGFDYSLEFRLGDDETALWQPVYGDLPSLYTPDPVGINSGYPIASPYTINEYRYDRRPPDIPYRSYMTGKHIAGELGPITNISGPVTARVTAYDWSGAQVCRQVSFYLDGTVDVGPASVDRQLFSPGTSSSLSSVALSIDPIEPLMVTAVVRRIEIDGLGRQAIGNAVRNLVANLSVPAGQRDLVWDGKDDAGNYVADGLYTFDITYEDGCGNLKAPSSGNELDAVRRSLQVEVDRTPPALLLDRPADGNVTSLFLDIFGSATDKNMLQWTLEYSLDSTPDVWTLLASQTTGVDLRKLATLNATAMEGVITLRLRAVDKVELNSEVTRVLRLIAPLPLIRKFGTSPDPFSPNGDGRRDTLNIVYDVFQSAALDLTVKRNGVAVRHLLSQSLTVPGEKSLVWNGLDDVSTPIPDGEYTVEIKATSSADPTNVQTEQSTVLLDATPPLFTLNSALKPFMPGNAALKGSVSDLSLISYQVYIEGPLPSTRRVLLTEGSENIANSLLGTLDQLGLDDAGYRIRVLATDAAENSTNYQSADFELDSKAPDVSFSNPAPGTFVSRARPAQITGLLDDLNLLSAVLKIGGASVLTQTVASTPASVSFAFDGSEMPDGAYATQLIGTDKAGNVGIANGSVNVDNTPPVALIASPAANAPIGTQVPVIGTASDANLESWKLELGSGVGQNVDSLTVIASGTNSIDNAELAQLIGLPPDGPATLRLTVADKGGNISVFDVPLQIDATPPNAPVLTGQREQRNDARLSWTQADDATRITGYNLFRNGSKVNTQPLTDLQYLDAGLNDGNYAYTVTAVSRSGTESAPSNTVNIVISPGPLAQITKPEADSVVGGLVSIEGSAYSVTNFRDYQVSVGAGEAPDTWTELRNSPLPVQGGVLATWSTAGLPEDAVYTIRLVAGDILGGTTTAQVKVTIDNTPPAQPLGLQAQLSGTNDVSLSWTANTEPDLAGYLLYRDGRLVNQIDPTDSSILPYLLNATTYLDKARPDGTFVYTVVAVDKAGNQSIPSNPASVMVDTRPPHAVIVQPADGANVDGVVYVRADSQDTDIATVRFEFKSSAAPDWSVIGVSNTAPYSVNWDTQGVPDGPTQLRAVAIDLTDHTDPAPDAITVIRKNLARPLAPQDLTAQVDGGDVTLNWSASGSSDLRGYYIQRTDPPGADGHSATTRLNAAPVTDTTFVDAGRPDGSYQYQVLAVNSNDNESDATPVATAVVYTTKLKQPYTPVVQDATLLNGSSLNAADAVTLVTTPEIGTQVTQSLTPDDQGNFTADALPLAKGANIFAARQTDAAGNRSRAGTARVARGDLPAAPATVTAIASGGVYQTTWAASASADVASYVLGLDGQANLQPFSFVTASASSTTAYYASADNAIDADDYSAWKPDAADPNPSIELGTAGKELMTGLSIVWRPYMAGPAHFVIEAWDGYVWVPLKEETANTDSSLQLTLDPPYYTDRIRISFAASVNGYSDAIVSDVQGKSMPVVAGTAADVTAPDGVHTVSVRALSALGLLGEAANSSPTAIGDTTAPPPVVASASVSGAMVTVSWTESFAPDLAQYEVWRDGVLIATVPAGQPRQYVDGPLVNGHYVYTVRPVDHVGNQGQMSNEAAADIALAVPEAPLLSLQAPPVGGELRLIWQAPTSGATIACYTVYRSSTAGGPYDQLGKTDFQTLAYSDTAVSNGARYYYVVRSCDAAGNESAPSNEVNGVPADLTAPVAPVIFYPTDSDHPISTGQSSTAVRLFSEPGAQVVLSRDGVVLGSVTALGTLRSTVVSDFSWQWVPAPRADLVATETYDSLIIRRVTPAQDGSAASTALQTVSGIDYGPALAWSPDAAKIALPNYFGGAKVVQVSDGSVTESVFDAIIYAMAWHPDGTRWIVIINNGMDLAEVQVDSGVSRVIASASSRFFSLALSPDGGHVAVMDGYALALLSLADGSSTPVTGPEPYGSPMTWAPDGNSLYFLAQDAFSGLNQVYRLQLGQSSPVAVTAEANGVDQFSLSPTGALTFVSAGQLRMLDSAGAVSLVSNLQGYVNGIQWANSGALFVLDSSGLNALLLPGTAVFPFVPLNSGQNLFVAQATDASNNTGPQSEAINVTYDLAQIAKPDFSVQAPDLTVLPAVPTVGAASRIILVVHNLGSAVAPSAGVRMIAIAPGGTNIELLNTRTAVMAAGGSQVFRADTAFTAAGDWQLSVVVDPDGEVDESSKDNNVLVSPLRVVDATTARTVAVSVTSPAYPVGSTLTGSVALFNGQADIAGQINLSIEDAQGYVVATLSAQSQALLPYGQSRTVDFSWIVPAIYDGAYQVHAVWADGSAVLAQGTAAFQVTPNVQVSARVNSDRSAYAQGSAARIVAQIDPAGTSPTASLAQATIRVRNAQGAAVLETLDSIGLVSATELTKTLDTSNLSLGTYTVELSVTFGGQEIARASAAFDIVAAANPVAALSGDIELDRASMPYTGNISGTAVLANTGGTDLGSLQYEVDVIDPRSNTVLASQTWDLASLPLGSEERTDFSFSAAGMPIGTLWVQLRTSFVNERRMAVKSDLNPTLLMQREITVFELDPPTVLINQPVNGAYLRAAQSVLAAAADLLSGVRSVEFQVDGGSWQAMILSDPVQSNYGGILPLLPDGPHQVAVRATDNSGNVSQPVQSDFVVDSVPPVIAISGVADAAAYTDPVTPVISVTDLNLSVVQILLDGVPFISGSQISQSGAYVLQVDAVDLAGNTASQTVRLSVAATAGDVTPPVIDIRTPLEGAYIRRGASGLSATVVDAESAVAQAEFSIDGGVFNPLAIDASQGIAGLYTASLDELADGPHSVVVRASDTQGNEATTGARHFTVDNTPPVITITGVSAGRYSAAVTPVISVTDAALLSSSATLNGVAYASGTPIAANGHYTLTVNAEDKAGNTSTSTLKFAIRLPVADTTPPDVFIEQPAEDAYVRSGALLIVSATDTGSGVADVEQRLDALGPWTSMAVSATTGKYTLDVGSLPDGLHTASVRATDNADNTSVVQARQFTVDNTPPSVVISGVANDGQYPGSASATVAISDLHLGSSSVALNGQPYVSGSTIDTPGLYTLTAAGRDLAGNETIVSVKFGVITANPDAPVVTITTPAINAVVKSGASVQASVSPFDQVSRLEMAIDSSSGYTAMHSLGNGGYDATVPSRADGPITLRVRAVDANGVSYPDVTRTFILDNTPPAIDQLNVVDGGTYPADQIIWFRVTDIHLDSVVSTLDGQPISPGQSAISLGMHQLQITARDLAGNQAEQLIFFITTDAPVPPIPASQNPVPIPVWPMKNFMLFLCCLFIVLGALRVFRSAAK